MRGYSWEKLDPEEGAKAIWWSLQRNKTKQNLKCLKVNPVMQASFIPLFNNFMLFYFCWPPYFLPFINKIQSTNSYIYLILWLVVTVDFTRYLISTTIHEYGSNLTIMWH